MEYSWVLEADERYEILDNAHDTGYKYLLETKKIFLQLLRSFVKQGWVEKIDENNIEKINKTFITQRFKKKEADIVYKVKIDGQEVFFYILLELQSTVDFQMPFRLLQYMLEIWRKLLQDTKKKETERKAFRLPMIIPCVLYNGKGKWTACRSFKETLEGNQMFEEYAVDFKYVLFDVKRYDDEELLKLANVIGSAFFMDKETNSDKIKARLRRIKELSNKLPIDDVNIFVNWVKNILTRNLEKEVKKEVEEIVDQMGDVESMVYAIEEAIMKERDKGKIEGKIEGILELLSEVGDVSQELEKYIKVQSEIGIIKDWLRLAARVQSINEFENKIGYRQ